jgi:hypothetical protein
VKRQGLPARGHPKSLKFRTVPLDRLVSGSTKVAIGNLQRKKGSCQFVLLWIGSADDLQHRFRSDPVVGLVDDGRFRGLRARIPDLVFRVAFGG